MWCAEGSVDVDPAARIEATAVQLGLVKTPALVGLVIVVSLEDDWCPVG
jgi:hypothetical protein